MKFKTLINNTLIGLVGALLISLLFTLIAYAFSAGFVALLLSAVVCAFGYLLIRRTNEASTDNSKPR